MAGFPSAILDHGMTLTVEITHYKDKKAPRSFYQRPPLTALDKFLHEREINLFMYKNKIK